MSLFKSVIGRVATGRPLSRTEAETAFGEILEGRATPAQIGAFAMALRVRGETIDEIAGAVTAMRNRMVPVEAPQGAIDIVGTGGDHSGSFNVSTLTAILVAACGVPVAKHGNRAASSLSGSADVLTTLGVKLGLSSEGIAACVRETGIGFMMAPNHHPTLRHVGPVRSELGTRTIFNLLGPLCNPANVKRLLVGVFDAAWLQPIADTLAHLGAEKAWVVHGSDGLDEITTTGPTSVIALENGVTRVLSIVPADAGLPLGSAADLKGGDPATNAAALRAVLAGTRNAYRNIAVFNAAAALLIADKVQSLHDGARLAETAIDSGAASATLDRLVATSQRLT